MNHYFAKCDSGEALREFASKILQMAWELVREALNFILWQLVAC